MNGRVFWLITSMKVKNSLWQSGVLCAKGKYGQSYFFTATGMSTADTPIWRPEKHKLLAHLVRTIPPNTLHM